MTDIAMETLDIRRIEFSSIFRYSFLHSHFYTLQQLLTGHLLSDRSSASWPRIKRSPTQSIIPKDNIKSQLRYVSWAPLNLRHGISWLVSYYALFKGWLPLSQPPSCLRNSTTFPTKIQFRDLIWRSGLFPSWPYELSSIGLTAAMYKTVFVV